MRKPIVFDLGADDDSQDEEEERHKFRTERKTITFRPNETTIKRDIPDSLEGLGRFKREPGHHTNKQRKRANRRARDRDQYFKNKQNFRNERVKQNIDLRQLIDTVKHQQYLPNYQQQNPLLLNQGLTPLMNYVLSYLSFVFH